jgi:F-type H+-transporting ATPase subunit delta
MKNLTIAKRYAQAFYMEAKDTDCVETVLAELNELSVLFRQSLDFALLIKLPSINVADRLAVLAALYKGAKFSKLTYSLLVVLTRKRRLSILPDVVTAFNVLTHAEKGEILVDVDYAVPISENARDTLIKQLNKITGKTVVLREAIAENLLGGLRVTVGSTRYDASIRGRLDAIKARLH